jgi:hypothetical protein
MVVLLGLVVPSPMSMAEEPVAANATAKPDEAAATPVPTAHEFALREMSRSAHTEQRTPGFKMKLPDGIARKQREAKEAASQIVLKFNTPTEGDSPIEVEYGKERTQAAVVAVVVDVASSDTEISAEKYRESRDKAASISYQVYSAPRNFGAYAVVIEHWHINESQTAKLKTIQLANIETFKPQSIALAGLLPGVNQFLFHIRITDAKGVTSITESTSHAVLVHEVAAMDFAASGDTEGKVSRLSNGVDAYSASSFWGCGFTLTPAFAPERMSVKVQRRGKREYNKQALPPAVGVDVQNLQLLSKYEDFQTLALPFANETVVAGEDKSSMAIKAEAASNTSPAVMVTALGGRRYSVDVVHLLRASSTVAPLSDEWEYRLLLYHSGIAGPVETFDFQFAAAIESNGGGWVAVKAGDGSELSRSVFELPVAKD